MTAARAVSLAFRRVRAAHEALRTAESVPAFTGGVLAAGLGLGGFAVLVLFLWIISPFPDSGLYGALHIAADCWLLAHGTDLVRVETLSGVPAPVGVTPLLLAAFPIWLLYRAGADAAAPASTDRAAASAVAWLIGGYVAVAAGAAILTSYGPVRSDALSAGLHVPVVAALAAAAGAWAERGRPHIPLPAAFHRVTDRVPAGETGPVARSAAAGVAVLLAGGAVLTAVALVLHPGATGASFSRLSEALSGRLAVLALSVALIPNAAVWGAAYALGPGFSLGTEAVVRPAGAVGDPVLPDFPLLVALPQAGPGTVATWLALLVPAVAGVTVGWFAVDREAAAGPGRTAARAALGGTACGVVLALLTELAAGPLGSGALADFGPSRWLTAAAAVGWTVVIGAPTALVVRWVRGFRASRADLDEAYDAYDGYDEADDADDAEEADEVDEVDGTESGTGSEDGRTDTAAPDPA
ncbi:DUF6350 family protein [Streptomyces sp. MI02-7b]|uniref:cell division protein PerM n=1 Tax=Streptomyces sp. MI02-7b TaxID=462941 RepID=UPI0029B1842F|nr:DUF6350 family protein [Streptomyces sp. MI02-7b]MDX3071897.1 DUF6350 family protein [Streptomyces sp. MI02-7b]